jgi:hypothetical protein
VDCEKGPQPGRGEGVRMSVLVGKSGTDGYWLKRARSHGWGVSGWYRV